MGTHLTILSQKEIEQLYNLPKLTSKQRIIYFDLTPTELELLQNYRTPLTKIYFILQLAYFKFKQQFFVFDLGEVPQDISYLQKIYFQDQALSSTGTISKPRRLSQQRMILELLNYQIADQVIRKQLLERACHLATISAQPIFVFRDLMNWAEQKRIVLPGYSVMQRNIVGRAIAIERNRLEGLIRQHLPKVFQNKLDQLVNGKTDGLYTLTWLGQEAPNFNPRSLRQETTRKEVLRPIYPMAKKVIEHLHISNENIRYYAFLANHYTVGELKQFTGNMVYLFLLCYLQYRYRQINDVLVEAFKYYVRKYESQAKLIVKEYFYKYRLDAHAQLGKIPEILALFINDNIDGNVPFSIVRQQVLDMLDKEKILLLTSFINDNRVDEITLRWQHYEKIRRQISYNLRHLFLHIEFTQNTKNKAETAAALMLKKILKTGKSIRHLKASNAPFEFIPKYLQPHLYIDGDFQPARYELMLYQALNRQIEAGHIFINESFRNQSLDTDLIPLDYWAANKNQILQQVDLPKLLQTPQALLKELERHLEERIKQVNQAIQQGDNTAISIKNKSDGTLKWHLNYPTRERITNHQIYRQLPVVSIHSLLHWLNEQTNFVSAFTHVLAKGEGSTKPDTSCLIACIVALGTNHGLADMAARSDMEYNHLKRTFQNFIRGQTLQLANQIIADAIAKLPMFTDYNIKTGTVHSSSDGQKFPTRFDTINARHSAKYFGLGKGVSLHTMVVNHIPVNAKIIGANEHESHYVFDLLFNNPSSIQPDIHSTDSHGTNKVNFAILDCFGYQFAPRYKRFTKEIEKLVGFKKLHQYNQKYLIKPQRQINKQRFSDQWDTFQRIMASLALKTTSQSNIVRKLSSFARVNKAQATMNDYNDIIKSIFMLDYTHSDTFRRHIQKALNRGEGYHRLRKNVSYAHDGKIQGSTQSEQQIWSECTRLICNVIIYYNTFLLSQLLEKGIKEGKHIEVQIIRNVSPIAWQHINLYGLYQFQKTPSKIDWKEFIRKIKIKE